MISLLELTLLIIFCLESNSFSFSRQSEVLMEVTSIGQSQGIGGGGGGTTLSSSGNALLKTLPGEKIISTYDSIWSLSSESGNLGQMILTNLHN